MADKKIQLYWSSLYWMPGGNAYGYSTHNKQLLEAVRRRDDVELTPQAKVSFTLTTSDRYQRIPDKFNYLLTMFETDSLPPDYVAGLKNADHLIVPCNHNQWLFRKYTDLPISVCSEGVDIDFYKPQRRMYFGDRPFRYLWLAAANVRKGWECLLAGWMAFDAVNRQVVAQQKANYVLNPMRPFELYIKTTNTNEYRENEVPGVIWNSKNLSREDLRQLYYDAHCFVLPTMGEGFGLTLAEAMATGLPCVATSVTGTADFFDSDVGYVIDAEPREVEVQGETHKVYMPDPNSMVKKMQECYDDYATGRAQAKARRAVKRIEEKFTWDISAGRLIEIIKAGVPDQRLLYGQNAVVELDENYAMSEQTVAGIR